MEPQPMRKYQPAVEWSEDNASVAPWVVAVFTFAIGIMLAVFYWTRVFG